MLAMPDRPYRILVTVSRSWTRIHLMYDTLAELHSQHPGAVLVSGNAPKGDALAEQIWAVLCGYQTADEAAAAGRIERHPADWKRYGKLAGFRRNAEMVALGADEVPAFISPCTVPSCPKSGLHGSHGASHCAGMAERAGIPVKRIEMRDDDSRDH